MTGLSALVLALTHAATLTAPTADAPLHLRDDFATASPWTLDLNLHADRLGLDNRGSAWRASLAQSARQPPRAGAAAQPAATPATAAPASDTETAGPAADAAPAETPAAEAPAEACDIDCETCRDDDRLARYVTRNRGRTLRTHRAFAIAAWSTMLVTEVLGTIQMVNQPTWFGDGACSSNPEAFGCHNSSTITGMHEFFAISTTALYTTAGVLAVAAPDPENASVGDGEAESTLRLHKVMAYIHGGGMILLPLLGILTAHPQILGINEGVAGDFSRAMRTIHTVVGYTTFAALTFSGYLELF